MAPEAHTIPLAISVSEITHLNDMSIHAPERVRSLRSILGFVRDSYAQLLQRTFLRTS
jgi:hypothetical protein